jgi:hypothetical protein
VLRQRRRPRSRLLLTLAALASLILGYYLGQLWQRQPLQRLSAVVYPAGQPVQYPESLGLELEAPGSAPWRLFVAIDTGVPACADLLEHYAFVINRLAAWPAIQDNLRVTLLAYDRPAPAAAEAYTAGLPWAELLTAPLRDLDELAGQLGILPLADGRCSPGQGHAALVSPRAEQWALIPYEQTATMADNVRTIIEYVN